MSSVAYGWQKAQYTQTRDTSGLPHLRPTQTCLLSRDPREAVRLGNLRKTDPPGEIGNRGKSVNIYTLSVLKATRNGML